MKKRSRTDTGNSTGKRAGKLSWRMRSLALCSKTIRESNYENDDFLTYVCYDLFQKNQYDKVILTYLANYFCGATMEMKNSVESCKGL